MLVFVRTMMFTMLVTGFAGIVTLVTIGIAGVFGRTNELLATGTDRAQVIVVSIVVSLAFGR